MENKTEKIEIKIKSVKKINHFFLTMRLKTPVKPKINPQNAPNTKHATNI